MTPDPLAFLPLAALYAETHYRFRFFPFSLYFRRRPEILFDAPRRLEPGEALPVMLLIKDAHRFPVEILEVQLTARSGREVTSAQHTLNARLNQPLAHFIFPLDVKALPPGEFRLEAVARCRDRRGEFQVAIDNHPGLSHEPLRVYKAFDPLPRFPGWLGGELHCHTEYGADQVEFGAPLEYIQAGSQALGLQWAALTDHSYNLDDREDDCLRDDPRLPLWHKLREKAARLNAANPAVILLPGEELTCRNAQGRNVHLLILGCEKFLPGSGDGAQKWLRTRSELSVAEALAQIPPESFAAAAHPLTPTPLLEWLLVNRGVWRPEDLRQPRLDGWQALNGEWDDGGLAGSHRSGFPARPDKGVSAGLTAWNEALELGRKVHLWAGNDAHGNFNRFRQVKLPMLSLHERDSNLFGRMVSWIHSGDEFSAAGILRQLKRGPLCVSDGPVIEVVYSAPQGKFSAGESAPRAQTGSAQVRFLTTPEFGNVIDLKLVTKGTTLVLKTGQREERVGRYVSSWRDELELAIVPEGFLRAELTVRDSQGKLHKAFSGVVYVSD